MIIAEYLCRAIAAVYWRFPKQHAKAWALEHAASILRDERLRGL